MGADFDAGVSTWSSTRGPLRLTRPPHPRQLARAALRVPFALGLTLILLSTTVWMRLNPSATAAALEWSSTNIHNLTHAPVRAFVASALFLPGGGWLANSSMLLLVLVPLERRIGTMRALGVFASAHVVATIVTEGAVWLTVVAGALPASVERQDDVGISYGLYAVAAATCYFLPRRARLAAVTVLAVWLLAPFALSPDMTSGGHVLSLAIGLTWWRLLGPVAALRAGAPSSAPPLQRSPLAPTGAPTRHLR